MNQVNGPTPGVTYLTAEESLSWQDKLEKCAMTAKKPVAMCNLTGDDMPMPLEVGRHEGRVVIHVFRRPDISYERGSKVVAMAIKDVFGPPHQSQMGYDEDTGESFIKDCFFRDEEEIRKIGGFKRKVLESDSWYCEFPAQLSSIMPDADYLAKKLALSIKTSWSLSS